MMTPIDYKRELETASKGMIMIHDHVLLIKLLVRMIVRKARLRHAGMILYEPARDAYVLEISRGEAGSRIPERFIRFERDHPLIRIFHEREFKYLINNRSALVFDDINHLIWRESVLGSANGSRELLHQVGDLMPKLNSVACVPAFYHHELLAILLLGEKEDGAPLEQDALDFFAALASDVAMAIRNAQLFEGLKREADRSRNLFVQTTIALGSAIEAKDSYTHGHTERVTGYAMTIARHMAARGDFNAAEKFFENLYIASILHDIGKIGIPDNILLKPGRLDAAEFDIMKRHARMGFEILDGSQSPFLQCAALIALGHHEKFDGGGYPNGLKGEAIPLFARICAVADVFDALTSERPYKKAWELGRATDFLREGAGSHFDPACVAAFLAGWDDVLRIRERFKDDEDEIKSHNLGAF